MSNETRSQQSDRSVDANAAGGNASHAGPDFKCARCGRPDGQLPDPPFKGPPSDIVFAHTCEPCWNEWVATGTKVINELGLTLSTSSGRDAYDQHMLDFLQLDQV